MDMQQGYEAWTLNMDEKHAHATRTCGIDTDMQYGQTAWKCSVDEVRT
jgi:hypothetical protein